MTVKKIVVIFAALIVLGGCARSTDRPASYSSDGEPLYLVRGEVLWKGPTPVIYPIPLSTSAYSGACGKRRAASPVDVIRERLWHYRIVDVAVWLEPIYSDTSAPVIPAPRGENIQEIDNTVRMDEKLCVFEPNTMVVPVGTKIEIWNDDKKDHWFIVESDKEKTKEYVQYAGKEPSIFTFETPDVHNVPMGEPVTINADKLDKIHLISGIHKWMDAWIIVTDKFWFDQSIDKKGIFEINGVPKGMYRIHVWQPLLGENYSVVRVPEDLNGLVSVSYYEKPVKVEKILSTVETTAGEVTDTKNVWKDLGE